MKVAGSVGVITGGGGGLGGGVARMLVEGGGKAVILDLESSGGAELAASLGPNALFIPTDVTDSTQIERAIEQAVEQAGRIDLCVNAAGISPAHRVVDRKGRVHPLEVFEKTIDVNLIGAFDVLRHAAKAMTRNEPGQDGERGLIVNVSSAAGLEGQPGQAAYTASKGALVALTLQLARDLAVWGIRVMTIAPGIMDTPMLAGIDEKRRSQLIDLHVFPKRLGTPEDFAALVRCFMEVTLLNGECVRLDAATRLGP
ncbi:SDR family NAD(P)-dependent oxidoreductase [Thermocrispum sp.]|uniref:SDR family NAD(P)-dependent oxidoreductase n=1 Tax=Thermocrispum sp. TaxID=2060768 RepID=UPI0025811A6F|nr:SDR family NAD(P)-dependent oxidoreductase [Thermocrispum sp.]